MRSPFSPARRLYFGVNGRTFDVPRGRMGGGAVPVNPFRLPLPTITGLSQTFGSDAGGTALNVLGTSFQAGATVTIGGVAATVTLVTPTSISITTPAHTNATFITDSLQPGNAGNYTQDRVGGSADASLTFGGGGLLLALPAGGINTQQYVLRKVIAPLNGYMKATIQSNSVNNGADNMGIVFRSAHTQFGLELWMGQFGSLTNIGMYERRISDNSNVLIGSSNIVSFTNNHDYVFKLEAIGTTVNAYLDGVLKITGTTTQALAAGTAGMNFYGITTGQNGTYKNLTIYQYDTLDVKVTNPDGASVTLSSAYTYTSA